MADASSSKALQYIESKGWVYTEAGDQVILDRCPYCGKDKHFYVAVEGKRDGLHECKKCQQSGNLFQLMKSQGDRDPNMQSQKDWAGSSDKTENLPNVEACHERLIADENAMDYLTTVRGFSPETIIRQKLGLVHDRYFRDLSKEASAIFIPFLKDGRAVFAKYRSFPPDAKAFSSPAGWDAPLYNEAVITEDMQDIVFVEGEYDALSCLSNGVENVVGVPGANLKKTLWVDLVKHVPKRYILYDNDKAGEKGAQDLAERLGLDTCFRMVIPPFTYEDEEGNEKQGKDINDWFKHGGGDLEKFELLKKAARKFDVKGVVSVGQSLDDFEAELEGKTKLEPKYIPSWEPLRWKVGGWEDGDVADILAPAKVGKTTFALALMDDLISTYGEPGIFICGEMTPARLARKWLSKVTLTDDSAPKNDQEAIEKLARMKAAIPLAKEIIRSRDADLYFSNPVIKELDELYELMYNARRRYGVKFMGVDNLQLFCDRTLRNPAFRTIHLSQLSKGLTGISKELGLVLFRILQPKKIEGTKVASSYDTDGASQVDKDCDTHMTLYRSRKGGMDGKDFDAMGNFVDDDAAFEPEMIVDVGLSRYSSGGRCTLLLNGATSSISVPEKQYANLAATKASQAGNVRQSAGYLPTEEDSTPVNVTI